MPAKITKKMIHVNTGNYEFSHGHKPRGQGYWMFIVGKETCTFVGAYGWCKSQAVNFAHSKNEPLVTVCS